MHISLAFKFIYCRCNIFSHPDGKYGKTISERTVSLHSFQILLLTVIVPLRFYVLTGASMKVSVFWDVAPCILVVYQRFRGVCCLHHQGDRPVRTVTRLQTRRMGFDPQQGRILFFSTTSRPTLGPPQPPIQSVPEFFPRGKAAGA
jgi:hypothetical protein